MIWFRIDWTLVAICFSGAVTLYIIKFLISYWRKSQRTSSTNESDISEKLDLPYQEPPPEFNNALKCSTPISYVEIEEPPPSYADYLELSQSHLQLKPSITFANEVKKGDSAIHNFTTNSSTM